jgi:hypothetical protein
VITLDKDGWGMTQMETSLFTGEVGQLPKCTSQKADEGSTPSINQQPLKCTPTVLLKSGWDLIARAFPVDCNT